MKKVMLFWILTLGVLWTVATATPGWSAYSAHRNDQDISNFLSVYPFARSTKLDDCSLCHPGGKSSGKNYGSCDYCHIAYGVAPPYGQIPLNTYGTAYKNAGRGQQALHAVEADDSDGDSYSNLNEIQALTFPGDMNDHPGLAPAPTVLLTLNQIRKLPKHKQFLFLNAQKSQDFYATYEGTTIGDLLENVDILPEATQITVFAPDGFSKTFPIDAPDPQTPPNFQYDVAGPYPNGVYYARLDFVDYPNRPVYHNGSTIPDELYMILAYKRDVDALTIGKLVHDPNDATRLVLDGEGPYRLVIPQKVAGSPDRPSTAPPPPVGDGFDYDSNKDHNAGFCVRSVTAIRVEPLPAGTTDFGWTEGGWNLVDQGKLVIYGAIGPNTYPVTGEIVDKNKYPVADVHVSFGLISMGQVGEVISDADGRFQKDLPVGKYIVIPSKAGYTFKPDSKQINLSKKGAKIKFKAYPVP